jgi:hypothetical protein
VATQHVQGRSFLEVALGWLPSHQPQRNARILLITTLTFLLASSVLLAWPCRSPDTFIGHADQADLANLAQNIATGKGPVVDSAWLHTNGGIPGGRLPQPQPYWSVYAAYMIAPFFYFFGQTRLSLIIVPLLLRAVITLICVASIYAIDRRRLIPALSLGALLSFSPILNDSINGLSDIYLATATLLSLALMANGIARRSAGFLFWSGAMAGVSVGMKPSGIITFFALPLLIITVYRLFPDGKRLKSPLLYLAGGLIGLSVYFGYNLANFGSLAAPGYKIIDQQATTIVRSLYKADMAGLTKTRAGKPIELAGARTDEMDFTHFAQSNPQASIDNLPPQFQLHHEAVKRPIHNITLFFTNLIQGQLLPLWLVPFTAAGIIALGRRSLRQPLTSLTKSELLLLCSLPVLIGGVILATRVHFAARYWLLCMPFLLMLGFYGIKKTTLNPTLYSLSLLFLSLPWSSQWFQQYNRYQCQPQSPAYRKAASLLPESAIVLTTNPWQFSFHTRRRSVATPYTTDQHIIQKLAHRYGARYLAVIKSDTTQEYPRFRRLLEQDQLPIFHRIYNDADLSLYTLTAGSSPWPVTRLQHGQKPSPPRF